MISILTLLLILLITCLWFNDYSWVIILKENKLNGNKIRKIIFSAKIFQKSQKVMGSF